RFNPFIELITIAAIFLLLYIASVRSLNFISQHEIERATLFLPTKVATTISGPLIRIFTKRTKEGSPSK
ncbi:MAG: hypothetical protein ACW98Y_16190, partial [Candidatus Thorarchaeota archaeon]